MADDVLTVDEAAEYLKVHENTVRRYAREGKIQGRKMGRTWRFLKTSLDAYLRGEPAEVDRARE